MLSPARDAPFDRLGGFDIVERAVAALFARLTTLPDLPPQLSAITSSGNRAEVEWQVQLWLTDILGGPMQYDGPDVFRLFPTLPAGPELWSMLVGLATEALATSGAPSPAVDEARVLLLAVFPGGAGGAAPAAAPAVVVDAATTLRRAAESVVAAAGLSGWNLFVLDPDLVLIHQDEAASTALLGCDGELRRAFGLGATELMGNSVLRFHAAPTQLQGLLIDPLRLPRELTWCFGRTMWRARLFALPAGAAGRSGVAMAWRDESEAYRRDTLLSRLKAQAEELPVPVMFPDVAGELWFGNAACEHALARLAPWLPASFNPSNGIPGALFFPEQEERRSLFTTREALPLKKRMTFGPETVALLVSAVCDDHQRMVCPQVTWEIVHSIAPAPVAPVAPPARSPAPAAPAPMLARPRGVNEVSGALRREARAIEASALALSSLSEVLDALADQSAGDGTRPPAAGCDSAVEGSEAAARLAEQGLAALAAAREIASGDARQRAVAEALEHLMAIARKTNRLVLDASLRVVEDSMGESVGSLLDRSAAAREGLDTEIGALAKQAQDVARELAQSAGTASRLAELRESLRDAVSPPPVTAPEPVPA